jgi:hypothetical protein
MSIFFRVSLVFLGVLPAIVTEWLAAVSGFLSASIPSRRLRIMQVNVERILGLPSHTSFARSGQDPF